MTLEKKHTVIKKVSGFLYTTGCILHQKKTNFAHKQQSDAMKPGAEKMIPVAESID